MDRQNSTPGLVNWTGYLAITLLLTLPAAVLTVRSGAWQEGLLLYTLSCLGAALVLLVSVLLMLMPRFAPWRKSIAGRALITLPGTLLLLSVLASRGDYPPIHDITTDTRESSMKQMLEAGASASTQAVRRSRWTCSTVYSSRHRDSAVRVQPY